MIIKDFQGYEAEVAMFIVKLSRIWVRFWVRFNAALLTFFLSSSDHLG